MRRVRRAAGRNVPAEIEAGFLFQFSLSYLVQADCFVSL
jgi:hypothetical protein